MKKDLEKFLQKNKKIYKTPRPKNIHRFWGNATRLENRNVRGKNNK